jgi:hypothetical protein
MLLLMLIYFTTNKNTETALEVSKEVRGEANAKIGIWTCAFMHCHQSEDKIVE